MKLTVLVIDETLGDPNIVIDLLQELNQVGWASVARHPEEVEQGSVLPDVLILGANWLGWAREFRRMFPAASIIGRGPWQGPVEGEFFPWGDQLREPTIPITSLIPERGRVEEDGSNQ